MMSNEYQTTVPSLPSVPSMVADEAEMLQREGGITQQEDGYGAVVTDLDGRSVRG